MEHITPYTAAQKSCISIPEMAERLSISRSAAYVLAGRDGFPAIHIGKRVLIPVKALDAWIERNSGTGEW